MKVKTKVFLRIVGYTGACVLLALLALIARIEWATRTPRRPKILPAHATWAPAPAVPLPLSRRGHWVGCGIEGNYNRCIVTSPKGKVEYDGLFRSYDGNEPVPEDRLRFRSPEVGTGPLQWGRLDACNKKVPVIWLQDGAVLIPLEGFDELKPWVESNRRLQSATSATTPTSAEGKHRQPSENPSRHR